MIWGTVLTTLFSNLLVPGIYVFRELKIQPQVYFKRTLSARLAGAALLIASTWILRIVMPVSLTGVAPWISALSLISHLSVGTLAYLVGYLSTPVGRGDLTELARKMRRR